MLSMSDTAPVTNGEPPMLPPGLWRSRAYRTWLVATTADRYGAAVQALGLTLLTYALTGSTTLAGTLGTVKMVIAYGLALFGGLVTDRADRRTLMVLRAVLNGTVWAAFAVLVAIDHMTLPLLVAFTVVGTTLGALIGGAGEAALRFLVTVEQYPRASAVNQGRDASADILGGPLSGALFAVDHALPWAAGSLGYLILGLAARRLPPLRPTARTENGAGADGGSGQAEGPGIRWRGLRVLPVLKEATAGFRWILARRRMTALVVISLINNVGTFLVFTTVELGLLAGGASSAQVGLLPTAEAIGILIGSPIAGRLTDRVPTGRLIVLSQAWIVAAYAIALINHSFTVVFGACFLETLILPTNSAATSGFIFAMVPPALQGRVDSAQTLLVGVPVAFTSVTAGALVAGPGIAVGIAVGVGLCALSFAVALFSRTVHGIPVPSQWSALGTGHE